MFCNIRITNPRTLAEGLGLMLDAHKFRILIRQLNFIEVNLLFLDLASVYFLDWCCWHGNSWMYFH